MNIFNEVNPKMVLVFLGLSAFGWNMKEISSVPPTHLFPPEEKMSFLDNGIVRVGVNLNLGGAITYISAPFSEGNMVNNHDWGRQIQMSFYSGPTPYMPNGKQPSEGWRSLGWNPIQSGDYAGNRSKMLDYSNNGKEIYVKCIPMHWPLNNEPGSCFFESWIQLDKNTVKVRSKLTNHRKDTTYYGSRHQEIPAVYTNIKYGKLITYKGEIPFTGDTLTEIENENLPDKKGIQWQYWQATENWAAAIDQSGNGLGIWSPETGFFCGGRYGYRHDTVGTRAQATTYISPLTEEVLDHNIEFDYEYVLIAGSLGDIRDFVYQRTKKYRKNLPDYYFLKDRRHIALHGLRDNGWPVSKVLDIKEDQAGGYLLTPLTVWSASDAPYLQIEAAYYGNSRSGTVYFQQYGQQSFNDSQAIQFTVIPDGKMRKYKIPLASHNNYRNKMVRLKIQPFSVNQPFAATCKIRRIRLHR